MNPISNPNAKWHLPFNHLNPWTCSPEHVATQMQYVWNAHDHGFILANRSETEYLSFREINFFASSVDLAAASHFYRTAPTYENLEPPREDPQAPAAAIGSAASESPVPPPRPPRAASTNARDGPPPPWPTVAILITLAWRPVSSAGIRLTYVHFHWLSTASHPSLRH